MILMPMSSSTCAVLIGTAFNSLDRCKYLYIHIRYVECQVMWFLRINSSLSLSSICDESCLFDNHSKTHAYRYTSGYLLCNLAAKSVWQRNNEMNPIEWLAEYQMLNALHTLYLLHLLCHICFMINIIVVKRHLFLTRSIHLTFEQMFVVRSLLSRCSHPHSIAAQIFTISEPSSMNVNINGVCIVIHLNLLWLLLYNRVRFL